MWSARTRLIMGGVALVIAASRFILGCALVPASGIIGSFVAGGIATAVGLDQAGAYGRSERGGYAWKLAAIPLIGGLGLAGLWTLLFMVLLCD